MSGLPELVQAMLKPEFYPHNPRSVELVQTQMSFLFLTGDYVYKVKKPVDLGYLDYTTLEKRRRFCHQEVVLNRRLCPDVYLDVVPITQDKGVFRLGGGGEAVEYAVRMRQLPRHRMMDILLDANQVSAEMVRAVARRLAEFHRQAETNPQINAFGSLEAIVRNNDENFAQTKGYIGLTISLEEYRHLKAYTNDFIRDNAPLFKQRTEEGRIRDCHGDVHAAHICFSNGISIYDCIEFNDRFRYCDVASEVAFLAMDLDRYGHPDLSRHFVDAYVKASGDKGLLALLDFYKCYRACVRGKVEGFKLADPHIPQAQKEAIQKLARKYFDLACSYTCSDADEVKEATK